MPIDRISFPTQVWNKINSCAKRDKNSELKEEMSKLKKITQSGGNFIVWEPTQEFKAAAAAALEVELTFMRKQESATYKFVTEAIKQMRA